MAAPISKNVLVLVGAALVCMAAATWRLGLARAPVPLAAARNGMQDVARRVEAIESEETEVGRSVFPKELRAERCGRVLEDLWDAVNASTNKWKVLREFEIPELIIPIPAESKDQGLGIRTIGGNGHTRSLAEPDWQQMILEYEEGGWRLEQMELRHVHFESAPDGQAEMSRFYCSAHLIRSQGEQRAILEGTLAVRWQPNQAPAAPPRIERIDARQIGLRTRSGAPGFREIQVETVPPPDHSFFIDPLIVYDLDGDGVSEVILAAKNLVYHRTPTGSYESRPLCHFSPGLIFTALVADFDGDGLVDFLCAKFDGLYLFKGSAQGTFDEPGRLVWSAHPHLKYAQSLTCGDVDGNGSLDLWLGQYKLPYDRGQMPTPFFDANDGHPSFLLLNDGHGNFTDATIPAGLGPRRWRRAYSASFVDFNGDGTLDLVTASDFAGLELFANNGHGQFTDVTKASLPDWHGFGMSQFAADFDQDGRMDLLMIGMNVPTVERLQGLAEFRPGFQNYLSMGKAVASGNRLFLAQASGAFRQTGLNESVAHTGWSWGGSAFDFDNDGFPDLYVANGHESKKSVRDYETEFWLHDIYVGKSKDDLGAFAYFRGKQARTRGQGMSYGGYEKNRLFWNRQGQSFLEMGYLMSVALEQDSRNVVTEDLDGDGRMDLLVTTFEAWPEVKQTLHIFRNELPETGHWIGFRFPLDPGGPSPVGATIHIYWDGKSTVQQLVAGDSYRSQRSQTLHFGLGASSGIDRAEIHWVNGAVLTLRHPTVNQYHVVRGPRPATAPQP